MAGSEPSSGQKYNHLADTSKEPQRQLRYVLLSKLLVICPSNILSIWVVKMGFSPGPVVVPYPSGTRGFRFLGSRKMALALELYSPGRA